MRCRCPCTILRCMPAKKFRLPPLIYSLSARLLILTVFFIMLIEVFVYAPSVERYR